mgnify:CR=1 FL=1
MDKDSSELKHVLVLFFARVLLSLLSLNLVWQNVLSNYCREKAYLRYGYQCVVLNQYSVKMTSDKTGKYKVFSCMPFKTGILRE